MISSERRVLLEVLAQFSELYPDWRLGQLVANVACFADQNIWDAEDEQLIAAGQEHLRHRKAVLSADEANGRS